MNALETQFPPLAQALGRLRQPRGWPYAPRPADLAATPATTPATEAAADAATPALPDNDFLRILPEPALTGELPGAKPAVANAPLAAPATPAREPLTAIEAIALAPLNRTYWFDL